MFTILKTRLLKKIMTRAAIKPEQATTLESIGLELKKEIRRVFGRSLHIREVDTGSCGACESEIIAANNPIYDLQRFGINFVASPRHADALMVTGPLSKNMEIALKKTYAAMPEPKFVITVGDCALDGGLFKGSYYIDNKINEIVPVALHIPGCPPSPLRIMQALLDFMRKELA
ncbi:MAG: NADH-quinone oxidoreductase subunit B family protein [bacterium]|nr:NADH-quinone oxidoreductase subunit B family protein [bacterium]